MISTYREVIGKMEIIKIRVPTETIWVMRNLNKTIPETYDMTAQELLDEVGE